MADYHRSTSFVCQSFATKMLDACLPLPSVGDTSIQPMYTLNIQ